MYMNDTFFLRLGEREKELLDSIFVAAKLLGHVIHNRYLDNIIEIHTYDKIILLCFFHKENNIYSHRAELRQNNYEFIEEYVRTSKNEYVECLNKVMEWL